MSSRILFLEHNRDGTIGGSHYCLLEICRGLDRQRFKPVVWFYQTNSLTDDFRAAGAEVIVQPPPKRIRFAPASGALRRILLPLESVALAYRALVTQAGAWADELRRLKIDIAHLNNGCGYDHDLLMGAMRAGIPCIAHQRGFASTPSRIDRHLMPRFDSIISISKAVAEDLRGKSVPMDRVVLIHDGIDPARIVAQEDNRGAREALGIPQDVPVIGVVGNVKTWKGQLTLVRAMRHVVQVVPQTRCLIVGAIGDDSYHALLQKEVAEAGLQDRVIFTGYQRYPAKLMSAMDIVVHTSVDPEPFGIVILEGMALRKPVIATAHGGPLDVIIDGVTGFLTPPRDDQALAHALCGLLPNPEQRREMGEAGYQRLQDHFTAKRNVERIEQVYEQVLSARR